MIKRLVLFVLFMGLLFLGGLYAFRERLLLTGINRLGPAVLGADVSVKEIEWGPLLNRIHVRGLQVEQPAGFAETTMLEVPEIAVEVDPLSVITKKWRIRHARLDLRRVHLVQNRQGVWNFEALKPIAQNKAKDKPPHEPETQKPQPPQSKSQKPQFHIDLLELKVDEVVIERQNEDGNAGHMRLRIGLDERIEEVDDAQQLVRAVMGRVLWKTPLANLPVVSDLGLDKVITTGVGQVLKLPQKAVGTATETVEGAAKTLKDTASGALQIFTPTD